MKLLTRLINGGQSIDPDGRLGLLTKVLIIAILLSTVVFKVVLTDSYGPTGLPLVDSSYNFDSVKKPLGKINLNRVSEIQKNNLEDLILSSLDLELQKRLRPHLRDTLEISQKYQLDPYWVLAVMWTESHFVNTAKSNKNAHGLMQILPSTAQGLFPEESVDNELLLEPTKNIEAGVLYLKKLLNLYSYNYQIATVAYNQGPGNIKIKGRSVMINNPYLKKVTFAYRALTVNTNKYINKGSPSFEKDFMGQNNWIKKYLEKTLSFFPKDISEKIVYSPVRKEKKSISNLL